MRRNQAKLGHESVGKWLLLTECGLQFYLYMGTKPK